MKRNDPGSVGARNEHDDGERDTGIAIRAFFHANCGTQKSDRKYRTCEGEKILGEIRGQERSSVESAISSFSSHRDAVFAFLDDLESEALVEPHSWIIGRGADRDR